MHVEALPNELLLLIFKYVDVQDLYSGVPLVSRRWAALAGLLAAELRAESELAALPPGLHALRVPTGAPRAVALLFGLARRGAGLAALTSLTVHAGVRFTNNEVRLLGCVLQQLAHLDVFPAGRDVTPAPRRLRRLVLNAPRDRLFDLEDCSLRALHMFGEAQSCSMRQLKWVMVIGEQLTELTLRCAELGDKAYREIGGCTNLVALQLYSCWLLRKSAAHLARPQRLRRLHVTGAVLVRAPALARLLAELPRGLEELALSGGALGDQHARALEALPRLRVLEAWRCALSARGALRVAAACRRLRVLDLDLPLDAERLRALRVHPALQFVRCQPLDARAAAEMRASAPAGAPHFEPAAARFAGAYFRPDGEGFRGKVFYHWTPPLQLRPRVPGPSDSDDLPPCDRANPDPLREQILEEIIEESSK